MREIRVDHVTKRFGKTTALDDVTLSFEYGKIHALLGRNGAGKTTLLGIIANRLVPTERPHPGGRRARRRQPPRAGEAVLHGRREDVSPGPARG